MNLNRLIKYGELLAKGASEAQRIISENYDAKLKIIENIKSGSEIQPKFGQRAELFELIKKSRVELIELIEKDKEIFKRVKRWVESKESNTALKMLEEGMNLQLSPELIKTISKIIDINKDDHKILMKLGKLLDKQEKLVKEDKNLVKKDKLDPARFVKMFEKSLKTQHKYFKQLNYYGAKSVRYLNAFLKEAKSFAFIWKCTWAASACLQFKSYLDTSDTMQLEFYRGSIVMIIFTIIFMELLQQLELVPRFTRQIRAYLSEY